MIILSNSPAGWLLNDDNGLELKIRGEEYSVSDSPSFSNDKVKTWNLHDTDSGEKVGVLKDPTNARACYFKIQAVGEYYMTEKMFMRVKWGGEDAAPVFLSDNRNEQFQNPRKV